MTNRAASCPGIKIPEGALYKNSALFEQTKGGHMNEGKHFACI